MNINSFFDQVYLLCPQHDPQRKLFALQQLQRLGISALVIEGNKETQLSFLYQRAIEHAMDPPFQHILILRDDVLFHKHFHAVFEAQLATTPKDWKLLQLGSLQFEGKTGDGLPARRLGDFAIGLHRSIFTDLLHSLRKFAGSFDGFHLQKVISQCPQQCFFLEPPLIISKQQIDFAGLPSSQLKDWHDKQKSNFEPFQPDLVSIIMPAYNRAQTIEQAIRSALIQSYPHFELIVIDDASTDDTVAVVQRMMAEDQRIKLIHQVKNGGVGLARNAGIRHSQGRFVAFHDSDDVMFPDRLVKQLLPFYEHGVLFTLARVIRSHCEMKELLAGEDAYNLALARSRTRTQENGFPIGDERERAYPATAIFRREVFERWGLYWDIRYAEDIELIERILFHEKGLHFGEMNEMPMSYLDRVGMIEGAAVVIPEVLCIASKRQTDNLTSAYQEKQAEVADFLQTYRARFLGKGDYVYPKLASHLHLDSPPFISFPTLDQKSKQTARFQADGEEKYRKSQQELRSLRKSLSWRITAPLRFLGSFFMK